MCVARFAQEQIYEMAARDSIELRVKETTFVYGERVELIDSLLFLFQNAEI